MNALLNELSGFDPRNDKHADWIGFINILLDISADELEGIHDMGTQFNASAFDPFVRAGYNLSLRTRGTDGLIEARLYCTNPASPDAGIMVGARGTNIGGAFALLYYKVTEAAPIGSWGKYSPKRGVIIG